jgi:hypothetical protein
VQRILPGVDGGAAWRAGGRRISGGEDEGFVGQLIHYRGRITDGNAAAVESRIHPSHIVQQKDKDVGLLAKPLLQGCELLPRFRVLLRMLDNRVHIVCRFDVLQVEVLAGVVVALGCGSPCRRAAGILGHCEWRRCGCESHYGQCG